MPRIAGLFYFPALKYYARSITYKVSRSIKMPVYGMSKAKKIPSCNNKTGQLSEI
jgi:hypothetical protein